MIYHIDHRFTMNYIYHMVHQFSDLKYASLLKVGSKMWYTVMLTQQDLEVAYLVLALWLCEYKTTYIFILRIYIFIFIVYIYICLIYSYGIYNIYIYIYIY